MIVMAGLSLARGGWADTPDAERLLDPCSAWDRHFPAPPGGSYRAPRKIRHVDPILPDEVAEPSWLGAAVLDKLGRIKEVHRVRPVTTDPKLDAAIVKAIRQWRYEPYLVEGKPAEVCIAVFVRIDFHRGSH
jgi:hypothetical protein